MMRSLVCDAEGIVIAETVFRCVRCSLVLPSVHYAQQHYYKDHMDEDDVEDGAVDGLASQGLEDRAAIVHQSAVIDSNDSLCEQQVSPSSSLSDSHPNVVRALATAFRPCPPVGPAAVSKASASLDSCLTDHLNLINEANGNVSGGKSGQMKCAVCGVVKSTNIVLKRYGRMSCQVCYRFFRTFFKNPQIFSCPTLGSCHLTVRHRCRACWIMAAVSLFPLDERKQQVLRQFHPQSSQPTVLPQMPALTFHEQSENTAPLDLSMMPVHPAALCQTVMSPMPKKLRADERV